MGKPTMRGIRCDTKSSPHHQHHQHHLLNPTVVTRKCPKCGTYNGTRGLSCKNKQCDMVFKEAEGRGGKRPGCEAVKLYTGTTAQIFSVRLRDKGPDYRGFVQLP